MEILGYIAAIIIGLVLGIIGGGGSILSVPVFVYFFEMDAVTATAFSLFVVGITSIVGSVKFIRRGQVNFRIAWLFGIPSMLGILFSRRLVIPHMPEYIINRWGITLTKDMFILVVFAIVMLFSSIKMIKKSRREGNFGGNIQYTLLVSQGLLVGIITGLVGAGGGFLIVPALVMLLGMKIKEAVATSLFIISVNTIIGFISSLDQIKIDWWFLLSFSALSVIGILIAAGISRKIEGAKLRPLFGWTVLVMGIWIIVHELFIKHF